MLVSNWAQNYWAVSTVAKKTLYDYKNVFGRVVEPFIGSKDLDEVSLMDIQKLVLATTPHQARLALMILKTLYREAKLYGMTEKNPTIGVKLPKRAEPKRVFLTWDQVNALDWGRYNDQVRFLALHGLRWSEAVALTESDINDGYVAVNKSIYGTTKSASSNRKVPLYLDQNPIDSKRQSIKQSLHRESGFSR